MRGSAFKKGHKKLGGRKKGVQNKTTRTVKEAIQYALDQNADQLAGWLKKAGKTSGGKGIFAYTALAEFVQPKLSRSEHDVKVDDMTMNITRTVISKKV